MTKIDLHISSRFGLAVRREAGKQRDLGSNLLRLSFLYNSCGLWILTYDFVPHNYEILKWLTHTHTHTHTHSHTHTRTHIHATFHY